MNTENTKKIAEDIKNKKENKKTVLTDQMIKTEEIYLKSFLNQECINILSEIFIDVNEKTQNSSLLYEETRKEFLNNPTDANRKKETELLIAYHQREEEKLKIDRYRTYYSYHYSEIIPEIFNQLLKKEVILEKDEICISSMQELSISVKTLLLSELDNNKTLQKILNDDEQKFNTVYNNISMIENGETTALSFESADEKQIVYREYHLNTTKEQRKIYPPETIKATYIINDYSDVKKFLEKDEVMREFMTEGHYTTIIKRLKQKESVLYGYYDVFDIAPENIYKLKNDLRTYDNKLKCYFLFNNIYEKINTELDDEEEIVAEENEGQLTIVNQQSEGTEKKANKEIDNNIQNNENKDQPIEYKFILTLTNKENDELVEEILQKNNSYINQIQDIEYFKIKGEKPEKENNIHYLGNSDNFDGFESFENTHNIQGSQTINDDKEEIYEDYENQYSQNYKDVYLDENEDYENIYENSQDDNETYEDTNIEISENNSNKINEESQKNEEKSLFVSDFEEDIFNENDQNIEFVTKNENKELHPNFERSENEKNNEKRNIDEKEMVEEKQIHSVETRIIRRKEVIFIEKQVLCKITPALFCVTSEVDPNIIIGIQAQDYHEYENGGWIEIKDNYYNLFKIMKRQKVSYSGINKKATVETLRENFKIIKIEK